MKMKQLYDSQIMNAVQLLPLVLIAKTGEQKLVRAGCRIVRVARWKSVSSPKQNTQNGARLLQNLYQSVGLCKLENEILKEAKNPEKSHFRPKNVILERF